MHDSDWFEGECPCNDFPCKRSAAAQAAVMAHEALREKVIRAFYAEHGRWPKWWEVDAGVAVLSKGGPT